MHEITDGMKHDLEKVCCNNLTCEDRGEYPRCYLDIYRNCGKYEIKEKENPARKIMR